MSYVKDQPLSPQRVDRTLREQYPLPHRLFGLPEDKYGTNEWLIRRVVANIIVGGSREKSALDAVELIFVNFSFDELAFPRNEQYKRENRFHLLVTILEENDIKWARKKAAYVMKTCQKLKEEFGGIVPEDRDDLESLPGVGPHAASVIRGRGFGHYYEFPVDLHVRRIVKRMGLVQPKETDREIIKWFEHVSKNPAHLSRAFVEFGQKICRFHPSCKKCTFQNECPQKKWIK